MNGRRRLALLLAAVAALVVLKLVFRINVAIAGAKYLIGVLALLAIVAALAGALRRGNRN